MLGLKLNRVSRRGHRTKQYVITAEDKKVELAHVRQALGSNNYPEWTLDMPLDLHPTLVHP